METKTRSLKIEATGDSFKGLIKPKIRISGLWLERAGFKPGGRVSLKYIAPGVIELQFVEAPAANGIDVGGRTFIANR